MEWCILVSIETISIIIAAASVVIGVVLSLNSRKQELETRQAELLMQLYNRYNDTEFRKAAHAIHSQIWDPQDFRAKYHDMDKYDQIEPFSIVASFFEGVGVLAKRGLIDVSLIEDLLLIHTMVTWKKVEPIIQELRKLYGDQRTLRNFEYLYTTIKQREQAPTLST